jgi:hypothetical protein
MYAYMVNAMKKIKQASRRMSRDWAIWALSEKMSQEPPGMTILRIPNRMIDAEKAETTVEYPLSFIIAYTTGMVKPPRTAGSARIPT